MGLNKVMMIGNLGQDPELIYTNKGVPLCRFSIAINEPYHTEWVSIVVWGEKGEHCAKNLNKGRQVHIEGKLKTSSWTDKSGQKRYSTVVEAYSVIFEGGFAKNETDNVCDEEHTDASTGPMRSGEDQDFDDDYAYADPFGGF
jgi:single stranded DNA-binding protein